MSAARVESAAQRKPMTDLERMRHSAAHVLAQAVRRLYGDVKLGIGPPIEDGFYYDFDTPHTFTPEDLPKIEAEMARIVAEAHPFVREVVSREEALRYFRERGERFKVDLIEAMPPDATITFYRDGEFVDLCAGPHVPTTAHVGPFKLRSIAGAYWRGDERNPQLQRIYGTAFFTREELDQYLWRLEEARRRDHRKLGQQLELYSFHEEAPGSVFWLPQGTILRQTIEDYLRQEHRRRGYDEVRTPQLLERSLWERSGHWKLYKDLMYVTEVDEREYGIKPMNCLGAYLIYKEKIRSFRDLPLRLGELTGLVHRHEKSGVLNGLLRVRQFQQDDSHIFVTPEGMAEEAERVFDFALDLLRTFGFTDFRVALSLRDPVHKEKFLGTDDQWERAEQALLELAARKGIETENDEGGAKFYGPSLDIHIKDALGRSWQCTTLQIDFNAPERFDLEYIGSDNQPHRPLVLHRALIGSFERFIAVLVEHYAGALPLWLAPTQARVLPIADRHIPYAESVAAELREAGLRVTVDARPERINAKIRDAQLLKIPYMLVVGDKEAEAGAAAVRLRSGENLGPIAVVDVRARLLEEVATRR